MTRRRSRTRKSSFPFSGFLSALVAIFSGVVMAGWSKPDFPVVGPLVHSVAERIQKRLGPKPAVPSANIPSSTAPDPTSPEVVKVPSDNTASSEPAAARRPDSSTLRIASFNIQVFGTSKIEQAWIVEILAKVVRQFDIVAIQEVRAKDDTILPQFIRAINADGSQYDFVIGPRLGRSNSKEQYAFVYNTRHVEVDRNSIATINDPDDLLHREPFVARFRALGVPPETAFTFWLADVHTDPDEVAQEVDALADVFEVMRRARADEDDVIMLGDFNANEKEFGKLGKIPGVTWAVSDTTTNTRRTKQYDNLIFHGQATAEYTGRWGIVDIVQQYGITLEEALKVSDHLPIWAEFSTIEAPSDRSLARLPR